MKNIRVFLSENFQFLEVKFSIYLNRRVFVMTSCKYILRPSCESQLKVLIYVSVSVFGINVVTGTL